MSRCILYCLQRKMTDNAEWKRQLETANETLPERRLAVAHAVPMSRFDAEYVAMTRKKTDAIAKYVSAAEAWHTQKAELGAEAQFTNPLTPDDVVVIELFEKMNRQASVMASVSDVDGEGVRVNRIQLNSQQPKSTVDGSQEYRYSPDEILIVHIAVTALDRQVSTEEKDRMISNLGSLTEVGTAVVAVGEPPEWWTLKTHPLPSDEMVMCVLAAERRKSLHHSGK